MAATTGSVARWAASETATASAGARVSQPASRADQLCDQARMPALASTDRTNPMERPRKGSRRSRATMATARLRSPARPPPDPSAARATRPIAAARSTLGSVRQSATKATTPSRPVNRSPQPRTPAHRAAGRTKASSSVRLAPDTAVRWANPVAANSAFSSAGRPDVSPTTSAGTSALGSDARSATEARSPTPGATAPLRDRQLGQHDNLGPDRLPSPYRGGRAAGPQQRRRPDPPA